MTTQEQQVVALLKAIETGATEPVGFINPAKYMQHNLAVGDGLAGFGAVLAALPKGSAKANTVRVFEDGDFVVAHTEYKFFGPKIGFDIFRFEDGKIVEHWDNLQETEGPNPSNHSMIDGSTAIADLDKTQANKTLAKGFVEDILVNGRLDKLGSYIDDKTYTQHNPKIGDGLSTMRQAFEARAKGGVSIKYGKIHFVLGKGNFVLTASEGALSGQEMGLYDLFRIERGKIVEHWDTHEIIPVASERKNPNGKFGMTTTAALEKTQPVIEVVTLKLKSGVTVDFFRSVDTALAADYVSKQPGFVSRESAPGKDGTWLVIVHWRSTAAAEASMGKFETASGAAKFMSMIEPNSMVMTRYGE